MSKAKLIFTYATVAAGKSAQLIDLMRSFKKTSNVRTIIPEVGCIRDGVCVKSRNGETEVAIMLPTKMCPFELMISEQFDILFVDESQFLTPRQVQGLCRIVDERDVNVYAYGLRTDFKGNPFEGASYLMAWADEIRDIPSASFYETGSLATMNILLDESRSSEPCREVVQPGFHYAGVSRAMFNLSKRWEPLS